MKYYPVQIVPLGLKLAQLPKSIYSVFKDPFERMKICEEYRIINVSQYGNSVEVTIENDLKEKINLDYVFDQCVYVSEERI